MMKLKYLFDNRDLAVMLLENWVYDKEKMDLLNRFRISANAVYPFMINKEVHFLRFAPIEEKNEKDLLAELDFLEYLSDNGYSSADIVKSKNQKRFVNAVTPWGNYLAVVFKGADGKQIESLGYSDKLYYGYGKSLGQLHRLSKNYNQFNYIRPDWRQRLNWTKDTLQQYSAPNNSVIEADILLEFFSDISIDSNNYGLIHYDFELDNVFYNENTEQYSAIDFDDCVYHWFGMDIEQSIDSIKSEISDDFHVDAIGSFLSGYRTETELTEDIQKLFPVFRRYADIFNYARCLRSTYETWSNEPEWMTGLRTHLQKVMALHERSFGGKIIL